MIICQSRHPERDFCCTQQAGHALPHKTIYGDLWDDAEKPVVHEHCMERHPVTLLPCMHPAGHDWSLSHRTMAGVVWVGELPEPKAAPIERCAFCPDPAEVPIPGTIATCDKHEREGWRLQHRLEAGGLSDTEHARQEVLRHVAASDAFLREMQIEETGARTAWDCSDRTRRIPDGHPSLTEQKPPPEEIPLVGTTPHYEWP
jgi:hypothetical protein